VTIYRGYRDYQGTHVTKDDQPFTHYASLKVANHSPTGFEWGYGGSGPAQLALALLLDVTGDRHVADLAHQGFKWEFVCKWQQDSFEISSDEVKNWLQSKGIQ
jgi:hypothetical protein